MGIDAVMQDKGSGKGSLGCKLWPLDKHIEFEHQHAWEKTAPLAASAVKSKDVKYNAKVRLMVILQTLYLPGNSADIVLMSSAAKIVSQLLNARCIVCLRKQQSSVLVCFVGVWVVCGAMACVTPLCLECPQRQKSSQ